jgi:DNA repair protein RecO (recombination protein O)
MRLYRDRAVVLRQHKLGEADRIVTMLTRDHGLVRAVAKGVRRTRSKFGARLEPFAHIDVQLHPGRNLDIVTQVVSLDAFATDIVSDYGRYTCACAMLETAERLAGEEPGADRMRPLRHPGPASGIPHRRRRQRLRVLPPRRCDDTAAGCAGPDVGAARR